MYAIRNTGEGQGNPGIEPLTAAVRGGAGLAAKGKGSSDGHDNVVLAVAMDPDRVAARVLSCQLEPGERVVVRVKHGHAWATLEGDREDYVIAEGDPRAFSGPGLLVVQALEPGAVAQILGGRAAPLGAGLR